MARYISVANRDLIVGQFSLVQSLDRLDMGEGGGHEGQSPEILFQCLMREDTVSNSARDRDVQSLLLSIQYFFCRTQSRPRLRLPTGWFLERLS